MLALKWSGLAGSPPVARFKFSNGTRSRSRKLGIPIRSFTMISRVSFGLPESSRARDTLVARRRELSL
jgi:hypothetical protein